MTPDELKKRLRMIGNIKLQRTIMHRFGIIARDKRREGFRKSIAPDGTPWASLDPKTIERKKKIGGKARKNAEYPLIRQEILLDMKVTAVDNKCTLKVRPEREAISGYHNQGTEKIPRREHIGFYPGAEDDILKERDRYIEDQIKRIFSF